MIFHNISTLVDQIIKAGFPGRASLAPSEIALVLSLIESRAISESGIRGLGKSVALAGLKRSGGHWLIPVVTLIGLMEALSKKDFWMRPSGSNSGSTAKAPVPAVHSSQGRSRSTKVNRMSILATQSEEAWQKVWEKYDALSQLREQFALSQHLDSTITKISQTSSQSTVKTERF